ncbi:uncharacterized protein Dwil_GK27571 [Drosophila willistoni]|uniref:Uncharacterized protein n=1 Tax=Drosophila willistoni TaxID=7260 RepID=A0A0Q9WS37_DROWI|nr:uncharacterized protein Dwil_GK27571 [Drosophila willistoni]
MDEQSRPFLPLNNDSRHELVVLDNLRLRFEELQLTGDSRNKDLMEFRANLCMHLYRELARIEPDENKRYVYLTLCYELLDAGEPDNMTEEETIEYRLKVIDSLNNQKWQHQRYIIAAPAIIVHLFKSNPAYQCSPIEASAPNLYEELEQFYEMMAHPNSSLTKLIDVSAVQRRLKMILDRVKEQLAGKIWPKSWLHLVGKIQLRQLLTSKEKGAYEAMRWRLTDRSVQELSDDERLRDALNAMMGYECRQLRYSFRTSQLLLRSPEQQRNLSESYLLLALGHLGCLYRELQHQQKQLQTLGKSGMALAQRSSRNNGTSQTNTVRFSGRKRPRSEGIAEREEEQDNAVNTVNEAATPKRRRIAVYSMDLSSPLTLLRRRNVTRFLFDRDVEQSVIQLGAGDGLAVNATLEQGDKNQIPLDQIPENGIINQEDATPAQVVDAPNKEDEQSVLIVKQNVSTIELSSEVTESTVMPDHSQNESIRTPACATEGDSVPETTTGVGNMSLSGEFQFQITPSLLNSSENSSESSNGFFCVIA